ncbi:hypothetical protein DM860_006497 [Cuscuta australis]|uniref:C2H2-type domain-containing protein n=1 Tax=Cuscuta australis TaxID=267555 RepID=A0A328D3P7_9ASTE|nr:hypothetical protein DM860_006497 [Cuscuta australis]
MAVLSTFPPPQQKHELQNQKTLHDGNKPTEPRPKPPSSSSWESFKNLLMSCKRADAVVTVVPAAAPSFTKKNRSGGLLGPCRSICSFGGNAAASRRVVHRSDDDDDLPERTAALARQGSPRVPGKKDGCRNGGGGSGGGSSSSRWSLASGSSSRRMHLKKLSGCYECQAIVDPARYPMARRTKCTCPDCGEVFSNIQSLEHHRALRHAVLELGRDDSSRNIVEIIFKSSWIINNNKDRPACEIQRILKVHNAPRTIQRFEDYRDAVRTRAAVSGEKSPRCAADGNELLRFYCTTLACPLGAQGSSGLCGSLPGCGVCTVIRHGFHANKPAGIRTTASSGGAHGSQRGDGIWAMLVCRVIAGRVGHTAAAAAGGDGKEATLGAEEDSAAAQTGSYDSVSGCGGSYPNLEELYVFNRRAILPCFVVIYKATES